MKLAVTFILTLLPVYLRASVVILNGLTHTHTLTGAGTKAQGLVRVKNEGTAESRIIIYRQDLISECGKPALYPETGSHSRSLGNLLKTNIDEKVIGANEEYEVRYTIEPENGKSLSGTYWEVVMVEVAEPVSDKLKNGIQVNSKVRYAIQVIVDAGDFEGPKLSFENVVFEKISEKQSILKVLLKNNSVFGSRTQVVLEIYDDKGNKLKATEPTARMVYPGYCSTFEVPVNDLPSGKYDCVVIADTGKDLFGSNMTIQVE